MTSKKWKDFLLSSGLPLEQTVIEKFKSIGFKGIGEYKYERFDNNTSEVFSIDVHAYKIAPLWPEFFIECKFRYDGIKWVFLPDEYDRFFDESSSDVFIILDQIPRKKVSKRRLEEFADNFPVCGKGIELLQNDRNPKSISQSLYQIRYALLEETINAVNDQVSWGPDPQESPFFIFIPIVTTTAELWRIKPNITINEIKLANDIQEISEMKDIIVVRQPPSLDYSRYARQRFGKKLSINNIGQENLVKANQITKWFSTYYPSLFFVVNHNAFNHFIDQLLQIINNLDLIEPQ